MEKKDFILASGSPQRKLLLEQINLSPKIIVPADIDETNYAFETPTHYVKRMAVEKARKVSEMFPGENVLACDTVVCVGRRILHKAKTENDQIGVMRLISGRANRVLSAVCLMDKNGKKSVRLSVSKVITKKMSEAEIRDYIETREWVGCCGYKIEGRFAGFVRKIVGSYTGIVGLPLYETQNLLKGVGIK